MIEDLLPVLGAAGLHPDARELCDALWLAPHVRAAPAVSDDTGPGPASAEPATAASDAAPVDTPGHAAGGGTTGTTLHTSGNGGGAAGTAAMQARGPAVPALRHQLRLARALRPFKRRIPDPGTFVVDEQATAARIAEEGLSPVLHPAPRRWLDLTLVVDAAPTMVVWRRTVAELRTLMEQMGAFRTVRVLRLYAPPDRAAAVLLLPEGRGGVELPPQGPDIECRRSTASLDTTAGGQAVLVVSDTVGPAWQDGRLDPVLRGWAAGAPLAVVTLLPQRMWSGAGLKAVPAALRAPFPGAPNAALDARVRGRPGAGTRMPAPDVPVPVLELSERWLAQWADLVAGAPSWRNAALLVPQAAPVGVRPAPGAAQAAAETVQAAGAPSPTGTGDAPSGSSPGARLAADPAAVVRRFRAAASPTAFRLACCLSAAWLNLPVMRLVQRVALPDSDTSHLAEVYLGGLLTASMDAAGADPEQVAYDFLPGVRAELNQYLTRHDMVDILERTSAFVAERFGQPLDFPALLADPASAELPVRTGGGPPLAYVAASVLAQLGGQYAVLAARLPRAAVPNAEPVDTVSAPNAEPLSVTTAPAMGSWDAAPASATPTTPADDLADRATAPADPAAARPSAAPPEDVVAALLRELRRVGKGGQASALAERAIANTDLANPHAVAGLLQILLNAGMHQQVTAMLARDLAAHAAVDDPSGVAVLLEVLREAGASEQMTVLLERDPAAHAALDDPSGVAVLLEVLREAGASEQMTVLLERDPA
ncbi:SAV_2336 N-terminal domain-related protein, partial [Streptomyces longwoodensis]|uniref:SAV_2336 N-terminal domain-related protein n=1 Tax=Streptomyces longwoodensis TaxID=68231 RepID=UPI0033EAEDD4